MAHLSQKRVLEGVRRLSFVPQEGRCPQSVPFVACLAEATRFLGSGFGSKTIREADRDWSLDLEYTALMAVSGAAFRLSWKPGWEADNVELAFMSADPGAPFMKCLWAAGFEGRQVAAGPGEMRRLLVEQIDQGKPVLAFGIIGPPESCLLTGYDEQGEVAIGWNYWQDQPGWNEGLEFEPNGMFRRPDWVRFCEGMILLWSRTARPDSTSLLRSTLEWAVEIVRRPWADPNFELGEEGPWADRANGLAAYEAWARQLEDEAEFQDKMPDELWARFGVHDDAVGVVGEGRWYASQYLQDAALAFPHVAEHLLEAARLYREEYELSQLMMARLGDPDRSERSLDEFLRPAARRDLAALIRKARALDELACDALEAALAAL